MINISWLIFFIFSSDSFSQHKKLTFSPHFISFFQQNPLTSPTTGRVEHSKNFLLCWIYKVASRALGLSHLKHYQVILSIRKCQVVIVPKDWPKQVGILNLLLSFLLICLSKYSLLLASCQLSVLMFFIILHRGDFIKLWIIWV